LATTFYLRRSGNIRPPKERRNAAKYRSLTAESSLTVC
jgi:hypothetical protein